MPLMDIQGFRFGRLVVLSRAPSKRSAGAQWHCVCDCGALTVGESHNLRTGNTSSCGCLRAQGGDLDRRLDLAGRVFGKLTALRHAPRVKRGLARWECQCECGITKVVRLDHLVSGETISCGCMGNKRIAMRSAEIRGQAAAQKQKRNALKRGSGGSFTDEEIGRLFLRQRKKCANCQTKITMETMHRDHIVALSRRGSNDIKNIQLLCIPCNRRKYAKDPFDFARENGRLL